VSLEWEKMAGGTQAAVPLRLPARPADLPTRLQRPEWLKVRANTTGEYEKVRSMMRRLSLVTVC